MSEEFIAGKNPIIEALRSGHPIHKIWIAEGSQKGQMTKVLQIAKEKNILVQTAPKKKLASLLGNENHQGIVASVAAYEYAEIEDIFERAAEKDEQPFFLVLDELEDPHNLGSILRTADACGAHGVIIPKRRSVKLNATVFKTSAGAAQYVKVAPVTNVAQTLKQLRELGLKIVGSDMNAEIDFTQAELSGATVLVVGNEGKGMRRLTRENCDLLVKIPMVGKINSLNASVAAAVLMYEIFRRRIESWQNSDRIILLTATI